MAEARIIGKILSTLAAKHSSFLLLLEGFGLHIAAHK
jgi:hypothetical protein